MTVCLKVGGRKEALTGGQPVCRISSKTHLLFLSGTGMTLISSTLFNPTMRYMTRSFIKQFIGVLFWIYLVQVVSLVVIPDQRSFLTTP